jgi:hypothetical protein
MALKQMAKNPALSGRGLAKAGLIVGYIGLALFILVIVVLIAFGASIARLHGK